MAQQGLREGGEGGSLEESARVVGKPSPSLELLAKALDPS